MRAKLTTLAIVAILLGGTASAVTDNYWYEYQVLYINPCLEGSAQLDVTEHYVYKYESDGAGGYHVKMHVNARIAGEILDGPYAGVKLTGSLGYNYNINSMIPGQVYTSTQTLILNGQGQAPNYKVKIIDHLTINANGELTAEVHKYEVSCK